MSETILRMEDLKVYFPVQSPFLHRTVGSIKAVDGVSLDIRRGETLSLVGESGCGKTTIGRSIVRLNTPTGGKILYQDKDILKMKESEFRALRGKFQIVFQDPYSSLNPRMTILNALSELFTIRMGMTSAQAAVAVPHLLEQVGLSPDYAPRYPHEFSGGQRQRIAIAKAIALKPEFIVCDESVSALDVSIQSQIINLLVDLKEQQSDMTYLFISHALNVVQYISDRVAVMYLGKVVELADAVELFAHTTHPYAEALISAIPLLSGGQKQRIVLQGEVPDAAHIPSGCRFRTRCPRAAGRCAENEPQLVEIAPNHLCACHFV